MATSVEFLYNTLVILAGPRESPEHVRVKIRCRCAQRAGNYAVPELLFSDGSDSIPAKFPSALRLEIQLHFQAEDSSAEDGIVLGLWLSNMVKKTKVLKFLFPCEIFMAVTDLPNPYRDRYGDLVALGEEQDLSDDPAVIILSNKGVLVQVGQTGA